MSPRFPLGESGDEHVCTGACAPGFHPAVPPANAYGRAPAGPGVEKTVGPLPDHIEDAELRRLAGGCRCQWCNAGLQGWL